MGTLTTTKVGILPSHSFHYIKKSSTVLSYFFVDRYASAYAHHKDLKISPFLTPFLIRPVKERFNNK
jgi:hypothetical protein